MTAPKRRGKTGSISAKGGDAFSKEHHLQVLQGTGELIHLAQSFSPFSPHFKTSELNFQPQNQSALQLIHWEKHITKSHLVLGSFDQFLCYPRNNNSHKVAPT